MKVGDYVRTDKGVITKIKDIWEKERIFFEDLIDIDYFTSDSIYISSKDKYIIKSSPNIIDLIEVGDYVNGEKVTSIQDNWLGFGNYDYYRQEYEIKSIVTKEQFESMEYKVGE